MSNKERNRQKKLAKKKAKRKAQHVSMDSSDPIMKMGMDSQLVGCKVYGSQEEGMMTISAFRQVTADTGVVIGFCVDLYCLGVKDSFAKAAMRHQFETQMEMFSDTRSIKPEDAKKLIEGAVAYARSNGFEPHKDYKKAILYLHDVDSDQSAAEFVFGKDGKPFFISGPNDTPEKCESILRTLEETVGEGNFHYIMGGPSPNFF